MCVWERSNRAEGGLKPNILERDLKTFRLRSDEVKHTTIRPEYMYHTHKSIKDARMQCVHVFVISSRLRCSRKPREKHENGGINGEEYVLALDNVHV